MIDFEKNNITIGHIARHTPTGSGAPGREAAIIDIAQDFLLSYLVDEGLMGKIVIKGGTAIRKLYAGKAGRFSLDLDFAIDSVDGKHEDMVFDFISSIDGQKIGPFTYSLSEKRGKWYIGLSSQFNEGEIFKTKLDFSAYPWIEPRKQIIQELPIHRQYGFEMPEIRTISLEENIAEKIARLNRTSTARDLYDLNWIMENATLSQTLDKSLIRRLAVLKIWVDSHGMHCGNAWWRPAHSPSTFVPDKWLNDRDPKDVDPEDIGALAVPTPTAEDMLERLRKNYSFLMNLDEDEIIVAKSNAKDRGAVIQMLSELPGERLNTGLY